MMLLVRCPQCGHDQKCAPSSPILTGKSKRCVYCGKSFSVRRQLMKRLE